MIYDFAIVGAGMAGASLAAELAPEASVLVLEMEERPGYHATGRSAAFWEQCYGGPGILPLTRASGPWLRTNGFLKHRGAVYLARAEDQALIDDFVRQFEGLGAEFEMIGREALDRLVPGLRADWDRGIYQPGCSDIDVGGLHAHYLSQMRSGGARLVCRAELTEATPGASWKLTTADGGTYEAAVLVNAAGAWADDLAKLAGVAPLGIRPLRRTVAQLRTDPGPPDDLPLCLDISGRFYFKPESGKLWLSPHDETPDTPHDVVPEEIDVATAIDRLESVVDWKVRAVEHKWAGLRSFAPDRLPVYGRDPDNAAFAWFAGQGGYGIQTAPAAASVMADHLLDRAPSPLAAGIDRRTNAPDRLR
ncbi:FAD-dependent oxidoreductase [Qipengyuania sp. JC766]|uniref:NAD(P)/FAD-dependent oxidoreductase n=1 Tax=Qipengyuania sp. JC766 TaxID=3232139 RepID=UPI00345A18F4